MFQVVNETTGAVLATRARAARTPLARMRGLLGTCDLPEGDGLLLDPCNNVHMFGMRYPLAAIYLDRTNRVLCCRELRPGQIGPLLFKAKTVLELPVAALERVAPGQQIGFRPADS